MALKEPQSMDECVYFTNRFLDNNGFVKCWVLRGICEKCNKGLMGKPKDPKTGRPKIRATEFTCPECKYTLDETTYEEKLTANIKYKCPYCSNESELQLPFKRKKVQRLNEESQKKETVEGLVFPCSKCGKNIYITKKMK
jgi:hypothetical protein